MNKRKFLKSSAFIGLAGIFVPHSLFYANAAQKQTHRDEDSVIQGPFTAIPLPYAYNALEPHIDALTMQVHHDKHYQGYTNKLNAALEDTKFKGMGIEEILMKIGKEDTALRNNGGGYYNHTLFWNWMTPGEVQAPSGTLLNAITKSFGSYEQFEKEFTTTAAGIFGSGWAWLLADKDGKLSVGTTANQDNPLMSFTEVSGIPILGLDVWEHAYYLKHKNKRDAYIKAFMKIVNWSEVSKQYSRIR